MNLEWHPGIYFRNTESDDDVDDDEDEEMPK